MIQKIFKKATSAALILTLSFSVACQSEKTDTQEEAEVATAEAAAPAAAVVTEKRPAPEFFVIPEEMVKKRVWICEDDVSDIFHTAHDCSVLVQCKGKGTFRNLLLHKAIEDYGRYNCQECSKDLNVIFDSEAVRNLKS